MDVSSFKLLFNEINELLIFVRFDFDFKGWYVEDKFIIKVKDIKLKLGDIMIIFIVYWESYFFEFLEVLFDNLILDYVIDSLVLLVIYSGYILIWEILYLLVISMIGKFYVVYEFIIVILIVYIILLDNIIVICIFNVIVFNKKFLIFLIVFSYIWRNYVFVDECFF